jgi:hypothetical protein
MAQVERLQWKLLLAKPMPTENGKRADDGRCKALTNPIFGQLVR